ncbi:MAG: hypothetical protein NXI24_16745 [bacterium]|nr:hypothetical protein [bacterium]
MDSQNTTLTEPDLDSEIAALQTELESSPEALDSPEISVDGAELQAEPDEAGLLRRIGRRLTGKRGTGVAPDRRFLAVAPDGDNLAVLLECVYTARLLKKRHERIHAGILAHPCNADLLKLTGVFDEVLELEADDLWRHRILDFGPDVLYLPDQGLRAHLATLFIGAKVRIGGTRHRLISRLLRFHKINHEEDLGRLKRRGFDLFPELTDLQIDGTLEAGDVALPAGDFVVLSLFDAHDLTGGWPLGHAARFARQIKDLDLQLVVPVPALTGDADGESQRSPEDLRRLAADVEYLRTKAGAIILPDCLPADRAAAMMRAKLVVGPAGPETILASILKKPVIVLHDMKTYRNHPGHVRPPGLHDIREDQQDPGQFGGEERRDPNKLLKYSIAALREQAIPLTSYYIKLADSLERHIMPAVDTCIKDCPSCSFSSCVEYISPERVFEQLKKIVLPF